MSVIRRQVCPLSCFYVHSFFEFQGLRFHNTGLLTADHEVGSSNLPGRAIFSNDLALYSKQRVSV
jgi:hypothetical protein